MCFLYLSTLLNLFPIAIANFCPNIFTTHQTIMANIQKERDLVRPHLWALLQYNSRSPQRPSNNTAWRAGTAIHLHHTAASHCITPRRQREWYQKVVENVPVWEGRNTHARNIFEYARSVKKWEWNLKWAFPASSRIKGTSHRIGHHRRHPLVLWQLLLNLTTKQKLRWINSMRIPRHCDASMCGKCSLEWETILFEREIEHACVLMSAPHCHSTQMNYTGLIETKHPKTTAAEVQLADWNWYRVRRRWSGLSGSLQKGGLHSCNTCTSAFCMSDTQTSFSFPIEEVTWRACLQFLFEINQNCSWVQILRMWNLKTSFISPL